MEFFDKLLQAFIAHPVQTFFTLLALLLISAHKQVMAGVEELIMLVFAMLKVKINGRNKVLIDDIHLQYHPFFQFANRGKSYEISRFIMESYNNMDRKKLPSESNVIQKKLNDSQKLLTIMFEVFHNKYLDFVIKNHFNEMKGDEIDFKIFKVLDECITEYTQKAIDEGISHDFITLFEINNNLTLAEGRESVKEVLASSFHPNNKFRMASVLMCISVILKNSLRDCAKATKYYLRDSKHENYTTTEHWEENKAV